MVDYDTGYIKYKASQILRVIAIISVLLIVSIVIYNCSRTSTAEEYCLQNPTVMYNRYCQSQQTCFDMCVNEQKGETAYELTGRPTN